MSGERDLHVWKHDQWWWCDAYDHGPLCRQCAQLDEITGACFENVEGGYMTFEGIDENGEARFKMTPEGTKAAGDILTTFGMEEQFDADE